MATSESDSKQPWDSIQRQFRLRQPIRPFVSSTFTDFHEEREHLVKYVFPQLNSLCHQRGTYFAPVDLRWGISEDQSHAANVVALCLDYIQHCQPFFICLLGERYGTHRSTKESPLPRVFDPRKDYAEFDWLGRNYLNAAAKGHDWLLQESYHNCSITELEIVEAAFRNDRTQFCRFYMRDPQHIDTKIADLAGKDKNQLLQVYKAEDEKTALLVTDLKYRIANRGLHTQTFLTVGELGQRVLDDWVTIINQFYPPMMKLPDGISGAQFRQWALGESLAETRRRVFVPTPETVKLFHILDQHAIGAFPVESAESSYSAAVTRGPSVKTSTGIITLIGDRGCGKSAIVANWLRQFTSKHSCNGKVIAHYVGSSSFSTDIVQFMRRTIWELRGKPVVVSPDVTKEDLSSFHEVSEAFLAAIESTPCVLVLDGLDELGGTLGFTKHQIKELFWLPEVLPLHCKVIATTVSADLSYKALTQRKDNTFHVAPLFQETADKALVLEKLLALHCKSLDKQHLEVIVSAKLSSKPLFLSIVANELKLFGNYAKVQKCLEQYTGAENFRDLWRLVILRWTKDYGWTKNGRTAPGVMSEFDGWIGDTLRLIACSREGLTEQDILKLLRVIGYTAQAEVNTFQFALFRSATFDTLVERPGGLLKFYHEHLREAVQYFLLGMVPGLSSPAKRKIQTSSCPSATGVKTTYHGILASYFQEFPQSSRKAQELPYHYLQCENWAKLQEEIMKPEMFIALYGNASSTVALTNDLLYYWRRLQEEEVDVIGSILVMVNVALCGNSGNGPPAIVGEWSKPGPFSDADSFCSDQDSVTSSDSRLESIISALREIEVKESGRAGKNYRKKYDWGVRVGNDCSGSGLGIDRGPKIAKDTISNMSESKAGDDSSKRTVGQRCHAEEIQKHEEGLESGLGQNVPDPQDKLELGGAGGRNVPNQRSWDQGTVEGDGKEANSDTFAGSMKSNTSRTEYGDSSWQDVDNKNTQTVLNRGREGEQTNEATGTGPGGNHSQVFVEETCVKESVMMVNAVCNSRVENHITVAVYPPDGDLKCNNERTPAAGDLPPGDEEGPKEENTGEVRERDDGCQLGSDDDVSMASLSSEAVRSQSAVLAVHAGKFLAERSVFTQAARVLQLGLEEVIRYFPLNTKEQFLLTETQEALGNLSLYQLHKNSARSWYNRALATIDNMCLSPADSEYMEMLEIQGRILNHLGHMSAYDRNTEEAEGYLSEATRCLELCNNIAGQATAQYNLGLLRAKTGNFTEAENHLRKALYTREHWFGKSHPGVAEVLNNLAGLLCVPLNKDSYDRIVAEALYQRALRIRTTVYGDDHLLVATTLFHLGKLLKNDPSLNCRKEAVKHLSRALDIRTRALGPAHKLTNFVRTTLKQLEQEINRGPPGHSRGRRGVDRHRSASTVHSEMTWHKQDQEVHDRRIEESRNRYLYQQKYSNERSPTHQAGRTGTLGRERVRNKHLQAPRFRARSSSPALVRDLGGRRGRGYNRRGVGQIGSPLAKRHITNFTQSFRHERSVIAESPETQQLSHGVQALKQERSLTSDDSWSVQTGKRRRPKTAGSTPNEHVSALRTGPPGRCPVSHGSHHTSCDIPRSPFDVRPNNASTVHGPNSSLEALVGDPVDNRGTDTRGVNLNAWYHQPGRYPKDANDTYPPRRQQNRPNRFELPDSGDHT